MSKICKIFLILLPNLILMASSCKNENKDMNITNAAFSQGKNNMNITSTAFAQGQKIPAIHTCDGEDQSPPLSFRNVPEKTVSLALLMDDPDAPGGTFIHWLVWNIDPKQNGLSSGIKESEANIVQGTNSAHKIGYKGPCPPSGSHRYFFKLYALDAKLNLKPGASFDEFKKAIENHVIAKAELMGTFQRVR